MLYYDICKLRQASRTTFVYLDYTTSRDEGEQELGPQACKVC